MRKKLPKNKNNKKNDFGISNLGSFKLDFGASGPTKKGNTNDPFGSFANLDNLSGSSKSKGPSKNDFGDALGNLGDVPLGIQDSKKSGSSKKSKNDFGFTIGKQDRAQVKSAVDKVKDWQKKRNDPEQVQKRMERKAQKKAGLPRGAQKTIDKANAQREKQLEEIEAMKKAAQTKKEYDQAKAELEQFKRDNPTVAGKIKTRLVQRFRKSKPKATAQYQQKAGPNKPKSKAQGPQKPTSGKVIYLIYAYPADKTQPRRTESYDRLTDAEAAKAGFAAQGYQVLGPMKRNVV